MESERTEGWVTKRGTRWKSWKRRWLVLSGNTLQWFVNPSTPKPKGELDLTGAAFELDKEGRPHAAAIVTTGRVLHIVADDRDSLIMWGKAVRNAGNAHLQRSVVPHTSPKGPTSTIPAMLRIVGIPEEGSELRVWAPCDEDVFGTLRHQWFRVDPEASGGAGAGGMSALSAPGIVGREDIPGAVARSYTLLPADAGMFVGCECTHVRDNSLSISATTPIPIAGVDPSALSVGVRLLPHQHHKYCDRRIRVCTAEGRFRQGEVIKAEIRGPEDLFARCRVVWFRSTAPVASYESEENAGVPDSSADAAGSSRRHSIVVPSTYDPVSVHYTSVSPRPLSHLPPAPPDHARSPTFAEVFRPLPEPDPEPAGGWTEYPLFLDDVHHMIRAGLVDRSIKDPSLDDVTFSVPIGPIEPAPPNAREVFIEGEPKEGALLIGKVYYFGGHQGPSKAWWVHITPDGKAIERTEPQVVPPSTPHSRVEEGDPRVYRVKAEDVGCLMKFKYHPIRADGDQGHIMTSRPTKEIQPLSDADRSAAAVGGLRISTDTSAPPRDDTAGVYASNAPDRSAEEYAEDCGEGGGGGAEGGTLS